MNELKIFVNYGVLSHELKPFYTAYASAATAVCFEQITVLVPNDFTASKGVMGNIIIESDKLPFPYDLRDILAQSNGQPCFRWSDGSKTKFKILDVKQEGSN